MGIIFESERVLKILLFEYDRLFEEVIDYNWFNKDNIQEGVINKNTANRSCVDGSCSFPFGSSEKLIELEEEIKQEVKNILSSSKNNYYDFILGKVNSLTHLIH